MNIRKLFNIPTKQQLAVIQQDYYHILMNCDVIADEERKDLKRSQDSHDNICPKCRAKDIVNKIRQVIGGGKVRGDFYLGFGSIDGSTSINTHAVNHCNNCGNEWEKFKSKSISRTDVSRVCLNYLGAILENPDERKHSWKTDAIKVFDGCCAESIHILYKKELDFVYLNAHQHLKLKVLRRYYKSVYDRNTKN